MSVDPKNPTFKDLIVGSLMTGLFAASVVAGVAGIGATWIGLMGRSMERRLRVALICC